MLKHFDARLKFGIPAAIAVYAFAVAVLHRPLMALLLVVSWVAALVVGVRAKRIWLSLQGHQVLRSFSSDQWSHGFLASAVIVGSFALAADLGSNPAALTFAVGANLFYASGKLGCAVFGCCQFRRGGARLNLPRYEAATCLIACAMALALAVFGFASAGAVVAAGTYAVVRGASIVLRRQTHRVLNIIDPLLAFVIALHACLTAS